MSQWYDLYLNSPADADSVRESIRSTGLVRPADDGFRAAGLVGGTDPIPPTSRLAIRDAIGFDPAVVVWAQVLRSEVALSTHHVVFGLAKFFLTALAADVALVYSGEVILFVRSAGRVAVSRTHREFLDVDVAMYVGREFTLTDFPNW